MRSLALRKLGIHPDADGVSLVALRDADVSDKMHLRSEGGQVASVQYVLDVPEPVSYTHLTLPTKA